MGEPADPAARICFDSEHYGRCQCSLDRAGKCATSGARNAEYPSLVGRGAAGIAKGAHATDEDLALVESLMKAVGVCVRVEEVQLHAVTALSGSGPAYLFYLMEAMIEAAVSLGLSEEEAHLLCVETVGGAADLMAASDCGPSVLRERVTSKGGTTAAAIESLEEQQVDQAMAKAMQRAFQRSQELA